jgi:hypothetical protein
MRVRPKHGGILALACLGTWLVSGTALADESADASVVDEVLGILKERGIVDESEYARLATRNASYEAKQEEGFLSRIDWSGDMRLRYESFWFDDDKVEDKDNRFRGRYRLRIKGVVPINDLFTAGFRVTSGNPDDNRSTNETLGSGSDFSNDPFSIDQAYLQFKAPSAWLGESTSSKLTAGKVSNPFRWKNGKDYMLWDSDITPEGGGLQFRYQPAEMWDLYLNSGYYVADENSSSKDPAVVGVQGGFDVNPTENVTMGARASYYKWVSLNSGFYGRGESFGNVDGGLSSDDSVQVGEGAWYVKYAGLENWPMLLFGHFAMNFDAEKTTQLGVRTAKDDLGWGGGLELGDKKKFVKIGGGWYRVEANFWPAQFTDSDLFDGYTNRKGWTFYVSRQIAKATDLNVTLFKSNDIRQAAAPGGPYDDSVGGSDRWRLQTDVVVKF